MNKIEYDWETYRYSENIILLCSNEEKLLRDIDTVDLSDIVKELKR